MKNLFLTLVFLLCWSGTIYAEDFFAGDFAGRKEWKSLSKDQKFIYLFGFSEAIYAMNLFHNYNSVLPKSSLEDLHKYLDKFYDDLRNVKIDVPGAFLILWMEQEGFPSDEINDWKNNFKQYGSSGVLQYFDVKFKEELAKEKKDQTPSFDVGDFPRY